jgi:hypothetical protein
MSRRLETSTNNRPIKREAHTTESTNKDNIKTDILNVPEPNYGDLLSVHIQEIPQPVKEEISARSVEGFYLPDSLRWADRRTRQLIDDITLWPSASVMRVCLKCIEKYNFKRGPDTLSTSTDGSVKPK